MSVNKDQVKKLYDATSQDYGLNSFEDFAASLQDEKKRKEFFDLANVKYDIGNTLEEFENNLGIKKKIPVEQQPLEVQTEDPEDPKKKKKAAPQNLLEQFRVSLKPLTSFQSVLPSQSEEKRKGLNYWSNLYSKSDDQLVLQAPKVSGVTLSQSDINRLRNLNTNKDRYVEEAAMAAASAGASTSEQELARRDAATKYDNLSKGGKIYVGANTALGGVFVEKSKIKDGAMLPMDQAPLGEYKMGQWSPLPSGQKPATPKAPIQTFTTPKAKSTEEFFLSSDYKKLSSDAANNLQNLTTRTNLGELVVDKSKLRSWMSSQFKKYGGDNVDKNSYFSDMVQARLIDDLSFEIDRPEVMKQAGIEYERMYGKKMSDDAATLQTEQITKLVTPINENYKKFTDQYVSQAKNEITQLNETYNKQVEELNAKYENNDWVTLFWDEFQGKIPQGQDPKKFIEEQYKKDFNALRDTYLTQYAGISTKHKAEIGKFENEYKTAIANLQKGTTFTGYGTDYSSKVKAAFTSAAKKVYKDKEDQRKAISESIGWVFPRALSSGVANVVSSAATFLDDNLQAGWVGWLKDQTQDWADAAKLPSNPIQNWSDLLDPAKLQQNVGEQLPNLAVSIGAALATKRPVMMANLGRVGGAIAMGTAGTLTENIQRQGQILQDLVSQGVDPAEASKKSVKIWRAAPIDIAINSFQMELLLGKLAKGNFLNRFATTAVGENLTEIPQEIRQTREEEQITGGAETPTKEIALSVLPTTTGMSLLGAGAGAVRAKEKFAPTWLNNATAYPFNKIAEQVINSSKGAVQAANSLNAVNGLIRTDALEAMNNVVEGVQVHVDLAKQKGLNRDQQTAYVTLMATAEDLQKKLEDARANNAPQERIDQLTNQFTNASNAAATLLNEKSGNYAVVLDEDGDRIVMTHDQLEQSLADEKFQDGVRSGAISVDVNASVMSDDRVKNILNTLSGLNSRFNQPLATYENESNMTKSLQQKLGIEAGAVQTPSTNAMSMVGKPVIQKVGDVEVAGELKVMGGYLVIENDEMVRPLGLVEDTKNLSLADLNMMPAVQDQVNIQTKTGEEINIPGLITMYAGRMNPIALVQNIMAVAPNVNEESLRSAVLAVDNAVRNGQRLIEQERKPGVADAKLQVATADIGKNYSGENVSEVIAAVGDKTSKSLMQKILDVLSFNFIGQEIDLDELYEKDQAFAARVEQMRTGKPDGNVEQSKRVYQNPENTPAIIIDGKVYDGYGRLAQQYINGQKTANAFVSTGSSGKKYVLQAAEQKPEVSIDRAALVANSDADVQRLKAIEATGGEDGATMNIDGTTYTGGGLVVPVISLNTTQEELTPEAIANFVEQNRAKLGNSAVFKVGLYKFPGSNKVSIDLNIVANRDQREMALEFARRAGQESLFDLDTFENVKTGATGQNPIQFTDDQFSEIAKAFAENRMPNVFGDKGKTLAEKLRERMQERAKGVEDRVSRAAAALRATGVSIRMIESPAEFERMTSQLGGQKTTEGIFLADTGEILINKTLLDNGIAAGLVVWHEASHPIVNIIRNTNPELYAKVVSGLKQAAKTNAAIKAVEEWAEGEYSEYGAFSVEDETIVETIAGITEGTIDINQIPVGLKQSIIEFINRIASLLGLGQILDDTDLGAFKKLAGDVANALRTGTDISEIVGTENVMEYGVNIGVPTQLRVSSTPAQKVAHKGGLYDLSFVSKEDIIDIESLVKDIASKNQNVWFWTADQLGRGIYFDKVINGEHYLDAGPSFALDPANRERNIIWATGKGEKWVNDKITNSDYIFIISGSPTKSKLFNRRVAELTINRIKKAVGQEDAYNKFKTEVLAVSKITELNNILNRHDSFESLLASPDRKQMLIKFDEQKAKKGTPLKALLENYDAFVDYNELRDGFYKENGFELNDVMLVLKPTGYGGKSAHSTYENDVLGEVVGVPDKKINAFDIMTDEFKAQYAPDMSRTEQSQAVAPYGAGIKKVQMSKGGRAVAQAMSEVNNQMTEDGQGNYVFYHYSSEDLKKIDPAKFGRNLATGRDERPGVGLSMYYTRPDVRETMVPSDFGYVVRIPKDNVYPFNEDPLELLPIAEREFNKKFPGQAFDLNKQIGFVTKVAADRGYPMTVAKWNVGRRNVLRAQTVEAMKPERFMSKVFEEGFMQENVNPNLDFVPNAKKRTQMSKGNRPVVGQINWQRSPEGKGDPSISSRNPVVTQAAADLKAGKITNEEYRATVSENSPIMPITRFFEPATEQELNNGLSKDKVEKINAPIQDNTVVGLRLDIPAYSNNNTWVVSVHEGGTNAGKAVSYRNVARITDVRFGVEPKAALAIATGVPKTTIGRMFGKWQNIEGATMEQQGEKAKALIQQIVDDPNYVQVGMNPFRHSYFYDRNTDVGRPIVSADEVIQVGGLVYAKNPVYGEWTDESYRVKGMLDAAGAPVQFSKGNRISTDTQIIDGFYSPIENRVNDFKQPKASATKWKEIVGVKSDEAVFSGLSDWLNSQKPDAQLSKQDVLNFMKENRIEIKEVTKGAGKEMSQSDMDDVYNGVNERLSRTNQPDEVVEFIQGHLDKWYNNPTDKNLKNLEASLGEANINLGDIIDDVESRMDDTQYSKYQLTGGENYKEVLITMPSIDRDVPKMVDAGNGKYYLEFNNGNRLFGTYTKSEAESVINKRKQKGVTTGEVKFKSSHFDEPNIITHLRMNTRTDADGKKVLFLEEVQSDWGQKGKREGFKESAKLEQLKKERSVILDKTWNEGIESITPEEQSRYEQLERDINKLLKAEAMGVTPAPFVTNTNAWVKLGLKYALKEAVRQGADRIAWTTGEQQNERYDLSKQVDEIEWIKNEDGTYDLNLTKDGDEVDIPNRTSVTLKEIESLLGKDIAEKIQNGEGRIKDKSGMNYGSLEGEQIKVGGKGMQAFYGDAKNPGIVANVATALVKELTGKGGEVVISKISSQRNQDVIDRYNRARQYGNIPEALAKEYEQAQGLDSEQPAIEITPELRQEVQAGMPQFSMGNRDNEIRQFIRENIGQYSPDEISQAIQDELGVSKADADAMVAAESKGQAPLAEEIQTFQAGTGEEQERAMADQFEGLAPEVESQIDEDARTYFAKTNKQTDEEVDNFINGKDMADLADYVVSNPNIPGRVKIWMAAKVAKNLGRDIEAARANGDQAEVARLSEKQANIYNTFAREATELGQAVQAFVAFNDDPNAVNFFLNKILRQLKERGVESITDQQRSEIIGLMQAVNNARPGLPKNKAIIQLSHYLGRLAPVKIGDVIQSIWYAHILSGVTTQLKNIYANTTMLAVELPIGATWQSMKNISLMPFVYAIKGLGSGLAKGIVKGADILRSGVTEKDGDKFFGTEPVLEYFSWKQTKVGKLGGGAVGKFLDFPLFIGISPTALKMVGRALAGADAFFSTTAQEAMANMMAYNEAIAEGKSGITPNGYRRVQELLGNTKQNIQDAEATAVSEGFKPGTVDYKRRVIELAAETRSEKNKVAAEDFGRRVTLTNEPEGFTRGIYQVATAIQQYMPISRVVIPFTRIVSNISEMIINYSPAGAYRALTGIKNPKLSFKFSPTGDNKLSDEARGELFLKSSMAIAAVTLLMSNVGDDEDDWFEITGGGPSDFQKKYELMKGGWRPYTITLKNGKKINYADWPIAGALSGLGTMRDIQKYEKEDVKKNESRLGLAAYGYATAFYDKSLIKGISDFVDLFRLKGKYGPDATSLEKFEKFMANQAKALSMTNFSQQVFKMIQEYNDDPIKEAKGWESLYRDLPVLNDGLNPIIDVFGDPVTPSTSERLLPYMTVSDEKKDAMIEMLNKKGIFIGIPEQKPFIELDTRTEREMTRDELYRYRKMAGEYTKAILLNRIDDISKAADKYEGGFKQKAWEKMIGNAVSAARKRAYVDLLMNTKTDINKMFEDLNQE